MATASPPSPPAAPRRRRRAARPSRRTPPAARRVASRVVAVGALALVVLIVAYLAVRRRRRRQLPADLRRSRPARARRPGAGRRRAGRQRHEHRADARTTRREVTIHVDSSLTPLHEGTTAQVRVPSLSSVANRYIALSPGPEQQPRAAGRRDAAGERHQGSRRPRPAVQHAQPEDAQGPAEFIQGSAEQYAGAGHGRSAHRPNTSRRR